MSTMDLIRETVKEKPRKCSNVGAALIAHDYAAQKRSTKNKKDKKDAKPYKCAVCGVAFSLVSTLIEHMHKHTGEKPFKCADCGAEFAFDCSLQYHLRVHKHEQGENVNFGTNLVSELVLLNEEEKNKQCTVRKPRQTRIGTNSSQTEKCNSLKAGHKRKRLLTEETSQKQAIKPKKPAVVSLLKCNQNTQKKTRTNNSVLGKAKVKKRCSGSKAQILPKQKARSQQDVAGKNLSNCTVEFAVSSDEVVQKSVRPSEMHCTEISPANSVSSEKATSSAEKSPVDEFLFVRKKTYKPPKPNKHYECNICGVAFQLSKTLSEHMRKHTGEKPFQCPMCPATFAFECSLQFHARTHADCTWLEPIVVLNEAPANESGFACEECGASYRSEKKLKVHMRLHAFSTIFKCCVCGIDSGTKRALKRHMKTHSNDKLFKCVKCKAAFTTKARLRVHMRKHSAKKL